MIFTGSESKGIDWEYLQINSGLSTVFVPQGDGTSELLVLVGSFISTGILRLTYYSPQYRLR